MMFFTKPFNYDNSLDLPSVTKEYLLSIGVEETSIGYYDEPENGKYDIPIESHPIEILLSQNYDCVVPVWREETALGGYLLARKGKDCMILYKDGDRCGYIMDSFVTIIPPINSNEFVVQNKEGKWGVVAPHKETAIVEFGKYKYLWGYDSGLCMVEVDTDNKQTFSNRGIIDSNGIEVIKPYTYTDIYSFYGKNTSVIKVELEDKELIIEKSSLLPKDIKQKTVSKMDYRQDIKKCYQSILEEEKITVNMEFSLGFLVNVRSIYQTLDYLKFLMVYAWEKLEYGTYEDFFHGNELKTKYLSFLRYQHDFIIQHSLKYLRLNHVRTLFDDNLDTLETMEKIINAIA